MGSDDESTDSTIIQSNMLKDLIKRRGVEKGKLTLFKKYLTKIDLKSLSAEQSLDLEMRIEKITGVYNQFEQIQDRIETLSTDLDKELEERELFENTYYTTLSKAKNYLKQCSSSSNSNKGKGDDHHNCHSPPESNDSIKYPDISLPSFSGNITQWIEFRDTFDALVNQTKLKSIQKFKYLRGCLKGNALEVISSLEYSEESYAIAWQLLCERYNNPRVLVYNHLRALFHIDIVSSNPTALRNLADNISKHLRTLKSLKISIEGWDLLVIFFLASKLELPIQRKWEEKSNMRELPTLQEFKTFLRSQADLHEALDPPRASSSEDMPVLYSASSRKALVITSTPGSSSKVANNNNTYRNRCPNCKDSHFINQCSQFLALNTQSRIRLVKRLGLCLNCLGSNHILPNCKASRCRTCKGKHHTLLHINQTNNNLQSTIPKITTMHNPATTSDTAQQTSSSTNPEAGSQTLNLLTNQQVVNATGSSVDNKILTQPKNVILSTARINVRDSNNQLHSMRAMLDSGAQSNYITKSAYDLLKLPTQHIHMEVIGFNKNVTKINKQCNLTIHSTDNTYTTNLSCFIVPSICNLPTYLPSAQMFNIPPRFNLADSSFYDGGEIDLIIGAELFYQLLCIGQYRLGEGQPILQRTRLGWVVSGCVSAVKIPTQVRCNFIVNSNNILSECDDLVYTKFPDDDVMQCEKIFATHTRTSDGNFVVTLPLQESVASLGLSRQIVYKRFKSIESKLEKDPMYKEKYVDFMNDFKQAGHMMIKNTSEPCNYLPHHAVQNPQKTTTPLRVVFDASFKTDTGKSLNDIQYKGAINQDNLENILIRFRKHSFVISADIEKMYRQIYINPDQQNLQCILWRENPTDPLLTYKLTTLSFGLKCAPYLATRCLQQLADENRHSFPTAASVITSDFFMDDMLFGDDSEQKVIETAVQVDKILKDANFHLRKWKSNSSNILNNITNAHTSTNNTTNSSNLIVLGSSTHKVLGLAWSSDSDTIQYTLQEEPVPNKLTKRKVLSAASAIFDPLGMLGPVIVLAKCFIQRLWKLKINWDEPLPSDLCNEWKTFYNQLHLLNSLKIPRHVLIKNHASMELHGFCDSSLTAYGAAIYVRSIDSCGNILVNLLCSKTRVARNETIPRLELRACLLLAKLYDKVRSAFKCDIPIKYFWSDSTVALAWIKSDSNKLITFVKNRVTEIKKITDKDDWFWVASSDNPADFLSRGLLADKLPTCDPWWRGPSWLSKPIEQWPSYQNKSTENTIFIESNESHCNVSINTTTNEFISLLFQRWSNLKRLTRCFAFILRFIHNCRNPNNKSTNPLSVQELNYSLNNLIKYAQIQSYNTEYNLLSNGKQIPKSSNLLCLNPFMDNGIMKVGGRLELSNFTYDKKHPTILPRHHLLTEMIADEFHKKLMHAGPQLLLSTLREKYWPIHGKQLVNKVVHRCVTCFRAKPKTDVPIMGNLPSSRVNPTPPFFITSIDYAGPFSIRDRRGRGFKASKCYIAVFICSSTKAVHVELVTSLETSNFLSAFRRFIARRGKPKKILSDNGTTFQGANNDIIELFNFLKSNSNELVTSCADEGIVWKFLPPYTPHMGGLHEAAVKSFKYHLKRVLSNSLLTYEEFSTVLIQIESILNSRPLCPIPSSNSDEIFYLTPAHFLLGRTPVSMPDYDYTDVPMSKLTHYQMLQQLQQDFWKRWSRDYIGQLQTRSKWRSSKGPGLREGTIVLIKEDRLPPSQWRLGRIIGCCQGKDNITRVAEIQTSRGVIKRAFNNICTLPLDGID